MDRFEYEAALDLLKISRMMTERYRKAGVEWLAAREDEKIRQLIIQIHKYESEHHKRKHRD